MIQKTWIDVRLWEEVEHGMWDSSPKVKISKKEILEIMKSNRFYDSMLSVVMEWENSCINVFSDPNINHVAWLGQAAMAHCSGIPQHITRKMWANLSPLERKKANAKAKTAISIWREMHESQSETVFGDMEGTLL